MKFELPKLKYKYNDLEPYIDAKTMQVHYEKHHATYASNLEKVIKEYGDLDKVGAEELLLKLDDLPKDISGIVRNNAGGYVNHNLFFKILAKPSKTRANEFADILEKHFGSFESFKEQFQAKAMSIFGSGWVFLVLDNSGSSLKIVTKPNQDSPISDGQKPILAFDVWEHAYYLNYQNRRVEYISALWEIVDWKEVFSIYKKYTKQN